MTMAVNITMLVDKSEATFDRGLYYDMRVTGKKGWFFILPLPHESLPLAAYYERHRRLYYLFPLLHKRHLS